MTSHGYLTCSSHLQASQETCLIPSSLFNLPTMSHIHLDLIDSLNSCRPTRSILTYPDMLGSGERLARAGALCWSSRCTIDRPTRSSGARVHGRRRLQGRKFVAALDANSTPKSSPYRTIGRCDVVHATPLSQRQSVNCPAPP